MRRNFNLLLLLYCFYSTTLGAQNPDSLYTLFKSIPTPAHSLSSDKLQQFYLINEQNDLIKYNAAGVEVFRYNNNLLGTLGYIDVSNPFHLLLYYPDYATLVSLDRTLNRTGTYSLNDLGVLQTHAVGIASDNNLWVYDELDYRLRKYNRQGQVLVESLDVSSLLPRPIAPISALEKNNQVYLHDPDMGILVFDIFGQLLQTIPLPQVSSFQILDRHLVALQKDQMVAWQLDSGIAQAIALPFSLNAEMQVRLEQNSIFVLTPGMLHIYKKKEDKVKR